MTFGEPASCRAALSCHSTSTPPSARRATLAGGAAAREVRLGLPQPVGAAREDAGAEGRVQLVPGEGDPVDVEVLDGDGVVRGELGGVEHDPGAVRVGGGGELTHGPQLAGDVRGARDADQGRAVGVAVGEGALQGRDGLAGRARGVEVRHPGVPPRQQRGVVLGLEDEDLAVGGEGGGEQVERVGGRPGEDDLVVRRGSRGTRRRSCGRSRRGRWTAGTGIRRRGARCRSTGRTRPRRPTPAGGPGRWRRSRGRRR